MVNTRALGYTFEVWDLVSRNIVGEFDAELDALAFVRSLASEGGRIASGAFALVREDEQGDSVTIATGTGLTELALRAQQTAAAGAS